MKLRDNSVANEKGKYMKHTVKRGIQVAAIAAASALALGGLTACSAGGSDTFNVWWYEKDTAMATTWKAALDELAANHKNVKINFQLKTWDQMQKAGASILDSDKAPDLTEYNKGNATAGVVAAAGLLTDLKDYSAKYGWDKILPASALTFGQYNDKGIMGSGNLYGIASYGEYVSWFYNKDMFDKNGWTVPTSQDELNALLGKVKAAGKTQCIGGKDYQNVHLAYAQTLSGADKAWVANFQQLAGPVDWSKWTAAATSVSDWLAKGYFPKNVAGISADNAVAEFQAGKTCPMILGGTWLDQGMQDKIKFNWDKFKNPGNMSEGSAGNLLVIPSKSKNKDLAAEFINMILSKKYQNQLGELGGLPLAADIASLKNPLAVKTNKVFADILATGDGLGWYSDWPVAGYFDIQLAAGQKLLTDGNAAAYVDTLKAFYDKNKGN
jgi:raffinose/stachyose/melibiose transport system substrate-binding protein